MYQKFKNDIWEHIIEESEGMRYANPFAYLAEFQFAGLIEKAATMEHYLVCHTLESMAYRLTERKQKSF